MEKQRKTGTYRPSSFAISARMTGVDLDFRFSSTETGQHKMTSVWYICAPNGKFGNTRINQFQCIILATSLLKYSKQNYNRDHRDTPLFGCAAAIMQPLTNLITPDAHPVICFWLCPKGRRRSWLLHFPGETLFVIVNEWIQRGGGWGKGGRVKNKPMQQRNILQVAQLLGFAHHCTCHCMDQCLVRQEADGRAPVAGHLCSRFTGGSSTRYPEVGTRQQPEGSGGSGRSAPSKVEKRSET